MRSRSFAKESQNLFCSISGGARRDLRPFEKKSQPLFPCTVCSYALKQVVVAVAVRFEVQAEVQKRLSQRALGAKQECDQQTPESAIAIQEGMNGLKLHVNQSGLDQNRQLVFFVVEKTLKAVEARHQPLGRRRNKRCIAGTRSADPVWRAPEFAGSSVGPTFAAQQDGVNFADESER